jgi:hypothetical protein
MSVSDRLLYRVSGTHTSVNTNEETTLQLPTPAGSGAGIWLLKSFHYVKSGGSDAYTPRLGQVAGWTNGDINERMTYSSTASGTAINDVFSADIPCKADANGRLYFRPGFAGAGNSGAYEFFFEHVRGA